MKQEIKRILKSKMLLATFVAVVILPLIYGGLYLWSFWDPYGKMENLPVAIVNEDVCQKKDKDLKCFGNDLVNDLKTDTSMKWVFTSKDDAESGLQSKKYYTEAIIPADFTKNIISVDGDIPQKANIEFKSRAASSFMAGKFTTTAFDKIKAKLNEKISKEYFENIFSQQRDSVTDLNNAATGSAKLANGVNDAATGSADLYTGIDKENSGIYDLDNALGSLYSGALTLYDGSQTALTGSQTLLEGSKSLGSGITGLNQGILSLGTGNSQLQSATDGLTSGQSVVIAEINAYIAQNPNATNSAELQTALATAQGVNGGLSSLKAGLVQESGGIAQLSSASGQLSAGSSSLTTGLTTLESGINDIATGSGAVKDGLAKAKSGSSTLLTGIESIKSGETTLGSGLITALNGATELKNKLFDAVTTNRNKTNVSKNKLQEVVLSAPVDIHDISIDIVNNNGTGFAPYFIPLALWVGSMAVFFLVDLEISGKKKFRSFISKLIISASVSVIQAVTLDLVMILALGLKVNNLTGFIAFTILLSVVSMFIQLFLTLSLELAGKFVGIILLMLQLTSSGGSYPLETSPIFFQKISPFLPMTYAVSALRELISGDNYSIINQDTKAILIFGLIFLAATLFYLGKPAKLIVSHAQKNVRRKKQKS